MMTHSIKHPTSQTMVAEKRRFHPWLFLAAFVALLTAGYLFQGSTASAQGTIPAVETRLIGPIDDMSDTLWHVAGVPVTITAQTRIDDRVGAPAVGKWARVIGHGDGSGGLVAARIKVLPPLPFVRLRGVLGDLTASAVVIDGITLGRTATTQVVGNPQPGDFVEARAAIQTDGSLLAVQVRKRGPDDGVPDDDPTPVQPGKVELRGVVQDLPANGLQGQWLVSGIPVNVDANTQISERVGPILVGSWVKVEGTATGDGGINAQEVKSIHTSTLHKLEGVLTSMSDTDVVVENIVIARTAATQIKGNPQPGQRVEVKAALQTDGTLVAVSVDNKEDDEAEHQPGQEFKFTGVVENLPANGLHGTWTISGRNVEVVAGVTEIDEHKGSIQVGVRVKVEALKKADGSLVALEIEVKRQEGGEHQGGDDHRDYTEFKGVIESLPNGTLMGDWVVSGRTVRVSERTEIESKHGAIQVGARVEVKGYELADGVIDARKIETKKKEHGDDDPDPHGTPTPHPSETPEMTHTPEPSETPETTHTPEPSETPEMTHTPEPSETPEMTHTPEPSETPEMTHTPEPSETPEMTHTPEPSETPEMTHTPEPSKTPEPTHTPEPSETPGHEGQQVEFRGTIVSFPAGLIGTWQIDNKTVVATANTEFRQDKGPFAVGVTVEVKGMTQADGSILAHRIKTEN